MSLFDENIKESTFITAESLVELRGKMEKEFGYATRSFMYHPSDFQDLDQIPEEKIDNVINDILSYIYYHVKLGLDNHNINTFAMDIPGEIFGVTPYNMNNPRTTQLLNKVTEKFKSRGFDCWLLQNDNIWKIQWYNVI